ncbi:MAG: RNA-binding protein [Pseudomonadota bacterium]
MTRGGRPKQKDAPERRCISTGAREDAARLIRFVAGPDGGIVPDLAGRLPGRGIWVSAQRNALDRAVSKRLFARAARAPVTIPHGLVDLVEDLSTRRLQDFLALARKAGLAVCGHDKVRAALRAGPVAALFEAADGAKNGKAKLRPLAGDAALVACLTAAELGLAFGRDHVIHAALGVGGLSDRVLEEAGRLAGLREVAAQPSVSSDGRDRSPGPGR